MKGAMLGAYRVRDELGSGGMGTVWLAEDGDGRPCAVKVIHSHLLEAPGFFKRFLREAEIGKAVLHPNVVRCHDADALVVDGEQRNFLVMEYVEGQTLRDLLEELDRVPEELCRHIGREVAKGLAAIHEAGVVHRDLKPENVLITPDHEVKIMDLGVARLADEAIRLSQTGAFVGSIHYAAPEQFKGGGEDLDGRADLHALGLILYELSSGTHPYLADDVPQVLKRVMNDAPRRLGEVNPQLSAFFEEVAHTLLAKDREDRFGSAKELLRALEAGEESTWWRGRAQALRAETKRPLRRIRIPQETAVYGREEELGKLRGLYDAAKAGDGRVVLIEGEAGIGKTRLVDELIGRLRQDGEDVNFLFGSYPPGGAATAAGAWSTAYREQFGAEGLEETLEGYLTVTPVLIPAFAALLRGEPPPEGGEPLTKDSIQTVFVHATRALAAERTTVVLIEDLHFAPEEGRAMFASLALAVPDHRILLIGTARPGLPEDWRANLERLEPASRTELTRLGPKDLASLLEDSFQSRKLADELGMQIARKSDGNPFFVFEIIRGLREGQLITRRPDGTWASTQVIEEIEIPSSVQDLIQARISDLDEEEQELLDVAACCGFEFDPGLVAEAAGLRRIPALRLLGHLEKSHGLIRSAGDEFVFDHHQVQESLYEGISPPLRKEYHAALGDALLVRHPEPAGAVAVEVCEHLLLTGRGKDASPHLDSALDHLEAGYLNDRAVELATAALGATGALSGEERIEVLFRTSTRLNVLGRRFDERQVLDEAMELAAALGDDVRRTKALALLGRHLLSISENPEALEYLDSAAELARAIEDRETEAMAEGQAGAVLASLGRHGEAQARIERSLSIAREWRLRRIEAASSGNLGALFLRTRRLEEAKRLIETQLGISRELGDRLHESTATGNLGLVLWKQGRREEAGEYYREHLEMSRVVGHRSGEAVAAGNLGVVAVNRGDFRGAAEWIERQVSLAREVGNRLAESLGTGNLGVMHWNLGRYGDAYRQYVAHRSLSHDIGDRAGVTLSTGNLGVVDMYWGRHSSARTRIEEWLALARELGDRWSEGHALSSLAELEMAVGSRGPARQAAEQALDLRREMGMRDGVAESLAALGVLDAESGDSAKSLERFEESLSLARELNLLAPLLLSTVHRARLTGEGTQDAVEAVERTEKHVAHLTRIDVRKVLWEATNDPAHLAEAHRLLCFAVDHSPEEYRESMIENVPLHRDIMAAWKEHGAGA